MDVKAVLTATPAGWRQGQTLFNFLEWLRKVKNVGNPGPQMGDRCADPFYITDAALVEWFNEFLKYRR